MPAGNPFAGRAGMRGEIYAYGLRNPWRFSFDRRTGDIAIGDVGQNQLEEINFARRGRARGANYGWRPWEGTRRNFDEPAPGAVRPVITKRHGDGWCSITGGYIVRDPDAPAARRAVRLRRLLQGPAAAGAPARRPGAGRQRAEAAGRAEPLVVR